MPAKFSVLAVTVVPFCALALACGGDDGGGGGIVVVDASNGSGSGQTDAPAAVTCYVESMYTPSFGSDTQVAQTAGSGISGSNAHTELWAGALDTTMTPDVLQVELYAGFAAFAGADITPKTIQIAGDELNYKSCGACVRIFADSTMDSSAAQYFATGGTITLSSVSGTFMGTLANVTLEKVTVADDFTSTPVGDGCTTKIVNATMNAALQMGSGSATDGTPIARAATANRLVLTQRHY
jgi:hypothetical protein